MTIPEKLKLLSERLDKLQELHEKHSAEIKSLKLQILALESELSPKPTESKPLATEENIELSAYQITTETQKDIPEKEFIQNPAIPETASKPSGISRQSRLEQFIGGNLINKVGIIILIFGLGLFVKYAIDNGFFPPLVRLVLSFVAGLVLVIIGYFLKAKYKTYSAVLFSGGMTVLYFTAYGGNVFFEPPLLPRSTSFILMVIFTIVTVVAAAIYDLSIIGLLGLVGAYAVPFLLSDESGDYQLLLSYLAVINTGILVLSLRKQWKSLIYTAFFLSWVIFGFWWVSEYSYPEDHLTGWLFLTLFFLLFYGSFIGHQFISKKPIPLGNIILLILNAFLFYGIGMDFFDLAGMEKSQGLFTFGNGIVHLMLSLWIYYKWADRKLFYILLGLFMTFLTIAIPVQFEGDIVPVLWLSEAVVLFFVARRFKIIEYELLAYVTLLLMGAAMVTNWADHYYESPVHHQFLWNGHFLTAMLIVLGLAGLNYINDQIKVDPKEYRFPLGFGNIVFPVLLIGAVYFSFFNEIYHHFEQTYLNSEQNGNYNEALSLFKNLWLINYSFLFLGILGFINYNRLKNELIHFIVIVLGGWLIVYFLIQGIADLNELRSGYLTGAEESHSGYIWMRYGCYFGLGILITVIYLAHKQSKEFLLVRKYFPLVFSFILLVVLSNELTTFMQLGMGVEMKSLAHKVGYSILWGVYSLLLIGFGFWKKSSQLRIAAIILFGVTLLKVFLIDLEHISTVSRMVVFIALGILMLLISYLYQRYKSILLGEDQAK